MNTKLMTSLKVLVGLIAAFHICVGIGVNVLPGFPQIMASYYGAAVDWTPEFIYIVKPLGAFMLVLGVLGAAAARDPLGHRSIVYGFVLLFAIRGFQRLIFGEEIANALAISAGRNIGNMIFFLALAAALFFLFRAVTKEAGSTT